jgi:hypothetical protein
MKTTHTFGNIEVPSRLASRLEAQIDHWAREEQRALRRVRRTRRWVYGIAASIALLFTIGIALQPNPPGPGPSPTDQEQAYHEAQKALWLVSRNFNKGMDHLSLAIREIEKTDNTINKTLQR